MGIMIWIWPVLSGVVCDILDWLNCGRELLSMWEREKKDVLANICASVSIKGRMFRRRCLKFFTHPASYVLGNELWLLHWHWNKWKQWYISLFLSLDCECVHGPPPALPIPLLIIVMSEKRSSGSGCWQGFDWAVVLAYTSKMKLLLYNGWSATFWEVNRD